MIGFLLTPLYRVSKFAIDLWFGPDAGDRCRDRHAGRYVDTTGAVRCLTCAMKVETR